MVHILSLRVWKKPSKNKDRVNLNKNEVFNDLHNIDSEKIKYINEIIEMTTTFTYSRKGQTIFDFDNWSHSFKQLRTVQFSFITKSIEETLELLDQEIQKYDFIDNDLKQEIISKIKNASIA